jgi:transcriptional regulator with XRE-family HTH domain
MTQETIGQRLKFLMDSLDLKVRTFASALDVSETNIRNYISKDSKPSSDILERIVQQYPMISALWLLTGEGEPFKEGAAPAQNQTNISGKKNNVAVAGGDAKTIQNNYNLSDCERDRDAFKAQLDKALREIELLTGQLQMQATIIEGKDQMLDLLRGGFNRPN